MKNAPIELDWKAVHSFYTNIVEQLHAKGINSLTTGGVACVLYGLTQSTKDCDIVIPGNRADDVAEILEKIQLMGHGCHVTLKYGAPLHTRWLDGGWSSHTYFGPPENTAQKPLARLDIFGRPPRVVTIRPDENQHFLSRDGVARMKKTRREKDWAYTNLLGHQMLKRQQTGGILHITDIKSLLETCKGKELEYELLKERPLLQLAVDGSPELERYVKAEKEFWTKLDDLRIQTYEEARVEYAKALQKDSARLLQLDFRTQNNELVDLAQGLLEPAPLTPLTWANILDQAKEKTSQIYQNIDKDLLPSPDPFSKNDELGLNH